ncbi:hypothetical protein VPH35_048534 [Triticum aestivum]|uniref:Protein kinase domain-containing protein n=1 Tax=Triticum aestivum TaxID=4565 RepID=A0A077RT12_WHEAT|nr:unnamed protein product [Triticum aestivum]
MSGHDDVQFDKEFYNLVNLQHQNIVRLVGYCHETRREYLPFNETNVLADVTKRALCFEFMENGSLSDCLFGKSMMMLHMNSNIVIIYLDEFNGHGWCNRYAIIKGICNGLKYLHEELKPPVFHLNLKPTNILLDKNMVPKIADFGFSRFFNKENSHITDSPVGNFGYLAPEYIHHGIISVKMDIFSLGVVVMKIISGPRGYARSAEMTVDQFTEIVHVNWRNRLQAAASGDLLESYSLQVKRCIEIALSCVEDDRLKRPTIGDIVNMLTETETQENYQGTLIDQMSTCVVKDTELIHVHPLELHFSFRPNKLISCPFHITNTMDDQHVSVRCVPKHKEANRYYAYLCDIFRVVPPRSTCTFVVMMDRAHPPPTNMDVLDLVVETFLGKVEVSKWHAGVDKSFEDARKENSRGSREVTLRVVCATTCETTTSEVILREGGLDQMKSMDENPTEPWCVGDNCGIGHQPQENTPRAATATPLSRSATTSTLEHSLANLFLIKSVVGIAPDITYNFSPLQEIGTGGFAVVYKGMVGKRRVAVKKLTRRLYLPEFKFHREIECMMKAKHKNIVRFLGYCAETQGEVADYEGKFVMSDLRNWLLCFEYLPNGSLENYITDTSSGLEWTERFRIIKGICEGLHYLHMNRILHLDLKPANILLDGHMVPKIADFELSRCLDEKKTHATTTVNTFGTPGYMAPEIFLGRKITFASDIYSLGSVIMEILTGVKGYPEDENVTENWIHRIEGGNQLQQVSVCTKIGLECMKFDPEKRPVAQHIIDMLDKVDETATSSSANSLFLRA